MVHNFNESEGQNLSLRRRIRRFWIEEKRLVRIGRSLLFHAVIAPPVEALLLWLGFPWLRAFLVAVMIAVTVEVVSLKSEAKDSGSWAHCHRVKRDEVHSNALPCITISSIPIFCANKIPFRH